jgi:predicted short-subunit dehydrogenase-like oxidoreductase (DUF2520 family)
MMNVAIIGSGNTASVLGRLLKQKQYNIVQVASRNKAHAKLLAEELGAKHSDLNGLIDITADIYIVSVSDAAITDCLHFLKVHNKPVFHTAGSVSKDILKSVSTNYGVLYPLQTLRKEMKDIPEMPMLIDANNESTLHLLSELASNICKEVHVFDEESRLKIHLAAVVVNNFTNHLYALAEDYCKSEEIAFDLLKPLIKETAIRIAHLSPSKVQTGPAVRNDAKTIDKHLNLLNNYPELKALYLKLSNSIINFNNKG